MKFLDFPRYSIPNGTVEPKDLLDPFGVAFATRGELDGIDRLLETHCEVGAKPRSQARVRFESAFQSRARLRPLGMGLLGFSSTRARVGVGDVLGRLSRCREAIARRKSECEN